MLSRKLASLDHWRSAQSLKMNCQYTGSKLALRRVCEADGRAKLVKVDALSICRQGVIPANAVSYHF